MMSTIAPEVFRWKGRVTDFSLPFKAIVEFQYEGALQRGLLFSDKLFKQSGELHPHRTIIVHAIDIGDEVFFDGHELHGAGNENCRWLIKRAWKKGAKVPIYGTGTIVAVAPKHGAILFENEADVFENRAFFMASKFFYFGERFKKNQTLHEFLAVDQKAQFEVVENERVGKEDVSVLENSCKYFARVVWKGQKPLILKQNEDSTPAASPKRQVPAPSASRPQPPPQSHVVPNRYIARFSHQNDELKPGEHMLADFWMARLLESPTCRILTTKGQGTFWSFLDRACGLLLWEKEPAGISRSFETVFFHRSRVTLAEERMTDKDLAAVLPEGCKAEFQVVPAPKEAPCKWFAVEVLVSFG